MCGAAVVGAGHQYPVGYPAAAVPGYSAGPIPPPPANLVPYSQSFPVAPGHYLPVPVIVAPRTLYLVAAIINWVILGIIICVTFGFGIICAAWFVPMTIQLHKGVKSPYKHTSLGVCTLLFCNIISGILVLADDSGKPIKPS